MLRSINVLLDVETEATSVTKAPPQKLVLLHLQPTLKQLHSLVSPHSHISSNLLITPKSQKISQAVYLTLEIKGVWPLSCRAPCGTSETISTLTDGDVEDQLLDLDFSYWVCNFFSEVIVMVCELGWFDEGRAKIEAAEKERLWNLFLDI